MEIAGQPIRSQIHEMYVAWRRWRLLRSFMTSGISCGNCATPSATSTALRRMEQRGILEINEEQIIWQWPD